MPDARERAPIESSGPVPDFADSIPVCRSPQDPNRDDSASAEREGGGGRMDAPAFGAGAPGSGGVYFGISTESTTWMTPLLASMSVFTTVASSTLTPLAV